MDTFRKWLNKPKADDKSLLARFYHADHALTAVASELDSFDGRAEPERCSRLVGKLRTGQEHVLGITNQIMDELLGDERASRAFRAKFPEEVLQESLAGQLWFGAECLAAGSSILNRELESASMRPLAKAVTKSLDNVRNLLREQCLRNNTPNSPRLNLNVNDAATEQLCESLKIFDKLFAEFELRYVSAMVTVKTKQEHEMQEMICVLFSETVHRALGLNLLDQDQVDSFDPALMFSIPRLAIVAGLVIYKEGPLNLDMTDGQLSEMFRPFRTLLMKIRDLLRTLSKEQLRQLERLLCTNEDVMSGSTYSQGGAKAPLPPVRSTREAAEPLDEKEEEKVESENSAKVFLVNHDSSEDEEEEEKEGTEDRVSGGGGGGGDSSGTLELDEIAELFINTLNVLNSQQGVESGEGGDSSTAATASDPATTTTTITTATAAEVNSEDQIDVINDCASGYLIPNTNLGYLLQPSTGPDGAPLTDSFISTEDDEDDEEDEDNEEEEADDHSSASTTDEEEVDVDVEHGYRGMVGHFIDNISTKSNTSTTASTGTASSVSTTTSSSTGERHSPRTSPTPSSSASTSSSSSTSALTSDQESEHVISNRNSSSKSPKCLQREREETANQDSGMCTEANSSDDRTPESESAKTTATTTTTKEEEEEGEEQRRSEGRSSTHRLLSRRYANNWSNLESGGGGEATTTTGTTTTTVRDRASCSKGGETSTTRKSSGQGRRRHHRHHHHSGQTSGSYLRRCVAYPSTSGGDSASRRISREEVDMALGTTTAFEDDHVAPEIAEAIRDATKNHENLLHRLFVCIAGVADQLQTNFASDLRKILRSVFLMNVSPPEPVIDTNMRIQLGDSKASDEDQSDEQQQQNQRGDDLMFEFRPSENDVNENGSGVGSNQSINSAEEVNPEVGGDNVFDETSSSGGSPSTPIKSKQQRCSSEGQTGVEHNHNNHHQRPHTDPGGLTERQRNINNNNNNNNNMGGHNNSVSVGGGGGTVTRSHSLGDTSTLAQVVNQSHLIRSRIRTTSSSVVDTRPQNGVEIGRRHRPTIQRPPRWVPDEDAPRCMSCATLFTAFRRRHHCRHCGRVFCGICSNVSVPIPKYGFVKAVRICQGCYRDERELGTTTFS